MKPSWILKIIIIHEHSVFQRKKQAPKTKNGKRISLTQPFSNGHESNKNSFISADFIYGRIETAS